jgi:predicted nuclease of predicted toxin-antitoxin system
MKLLYDQNLSPKLVHLLASEFPASEHVRNLGMAAAPDPAVWSYAASNGFTIVSKDSDFQQRATLLGFPPKVIWLRLGNCPTSDVIDLIRKHLKDVESFLNDPYASFLALG